MIVRPRFDVWVAAAVLVGDQVTKVLVRELLPLHTSVTIVPGFVDLTHVRNTGAAFGILNAAEFPFKSVMILLVAVAALMAIAAYAARLAPEERMARAGLALILGGAVGNLIDRVTTGYVVDFVDVYWRGYHFWAFNVADAAITIGASAMVLEMLGVRHHVSTTV